MTYRHRIAVSGAAFAMAGLALSGCASVAPPSPPSPSLAANAIGITAAEQHAVIAEISANMPPTGGDPWSELTVAGFNVIDQKCDTYVAGLYQVEKAAKTAGSVIATSQTAAMAVLHDFGVAGLTIDLLAQIFGVASAFNDTASKAYLLTIGTSNVAAIVAGLRTEYRRELGPVAARGALRGEADVVYQLQAYLRLCSPVYIEAYIAKYISSSRAEAGVGGTVKAGAKEAGAMTFSLRQDVFADPNIELRLVQDR